LQESVETGRLKHIPVMQFQWKIDKVVTIFLAAHDTALTF